MQFKDRKYGSLERVESCSGTFLVELAVLSTLLVSLLAGVVNFGIAFNEASILAEAARVAARGASALQPDPDGALPEPDQICLLAKDLTEGYLQAFQLNPVDFQIDIESVDLNTNGLYSTFDRVEGIKVKIQRVQNSEPYFMPVFDYDHLGTAVFPLESGIPVSSGC